jgi:hypothetical protein
LPALVLPSIPVSCILAAQSGGWRYVPFAIGLAVAGSGLPLGVGSFTSVLAPILVPDDVNPFLNRQANTGRGCVVGIVAMFALFTEAVLGLPIVIAVVVANQHSLAALGVALAAIALYSGAIWAIGVTLATHRLRGREAELISALSPNR